MRKKILVAYFSASGQTKQLAETMAKATGGDLYEITPASPYTDADLDWQDKHSRSSVEMGDPTSRPAVIGKVADMEQYDVVLVGFPIWWYQAPTIIQTFLESYDLAGKTVAAFATSGGSGMGETDSILHPSAPEANWKSGKRFGANASESEVAAWVKTLEL